MHFFYNRLIINSGFRIEILPFFLIAGFMEVIYRIF